MQKATKPKQVFICSECGHEHLKWNGQCSACRAWNTLEEAEIMPTVAVANPAAVAARSLSQIGIDDEARIDTGTGELNRVLGGGLVKGSLVLLAGEPGIGKSTLLLQICGKGRILYATGEESERQIKLRADRLGIANDELLIAQSDDCLGIIGAIESVKPDIAIIDSIQTMRLNALNSAQGSVSQVRECANMFMSAAKKNSIPIFLIGHVNKDGGIAGPKVLEHIVDAVLYFEGERHLSYRILRAVKNRYGSTNEIGVFEMRDRGLYEVPNPSATLLSGRPRGVSGISVLCAMEGARPILAEVQALVTKSGFTAPRRVSGGFDYNRLCLILAVLEKRAGLFFGGCDVYINIIGGLQVDEPAADLAVALALYSGLCDIVVPEDLAVFGEIGLGGEVRNISHISERVRECERMGFASCVIPKAGIKQLGDYKGVNVVGVGNLAELFKAIKK